MRDIQPIESFVRRVPEAGRIRYGMKGAKGQPVALDKFRFTSHDKDTLELLAVMYGGKVASWSPGRGRVEWELISDASEIDVVVPPNALGDTPVYELWSGGGLQRRCDGVRCFAPFQTRDGVELAEQDCVCEKTSNLQCKPTTRLNVLIPDVPFTGVWRLEAKGWNAAHELPGMVDMVVELVNRGMARAKLTLEKRTSTQGGQTRHFIVPGLRTPATLNEILEGGATLTALGTGSASLSDGGPLLPPSAAALESGSDDEIVDAEVVEEDPIVVEMRGINRMILELGLSNPDVAGFCFTVSEGMCQSLKALDLAELMRVTSVFKKLQAGDLIYSGLEGRRAVVVRPKVA